MKDRATIEETAKAMRESIKDAWWWMYHSDLNAFKGAMMDILNNLDRQAEYIQNELLRGAKA